MRTQNSNFLKFLFSQDKPEDPQLSLLRNEYLKHKLLYDTIKVEAEEVRTLIKDFETETTDWQETMTDSKGTKVMWKPSKGSPIHTLRLDGKLRIPVFNLLAVLMEVDLYTTWIPTVMGVGLKDLQMLEDIDRFNKVVHVEVAIPWPIANRDCNLIGYGVDLLDQGRVLAVARSFECAPEVPHNVDWSYFAETKHLVEEGAAQDSEKIVTSEASASSSEADSRSKKRDEIVKVLRRVASLCKPPKSSKIVRAKIHQGGFLLTPVSDTETEVSFLFQFDPDLAVIPSWLINWGMKHFSFTVLSLLEKAASKVGTPESPYTKRMADKPDVYEYLRSRLHAFESMPTHEREERKQSSLGLLDSPAPLHPELIEKLPTVHA